MSDNAVNWQHLSRKDLDFQLSPSKSAKDAMAVLMRHEAAGKDALRSPRIRFSLDHIYGPRPRAAYDLFTPLAAKGGPCLAFIHGGFWQEGAKSGSAFAAEALVAEGWALAAIGYSLTPKVRLRDIVAEIAAALAHLHANAAGHGIDPDRIVLAGHSAGGHLAAAMLAGFGGPDAAAIPAGIVAMSGVYDLAPVAASYVNDLAGIDDGEVCDLSPLFARPIRDVPVHLLIGGDEPDAFQVQTAALHKSWSPHLSRMTMESVPGRDHFDILDRLAETASPTFNAIRAMVQ
ncbi:MAG: alpha/beta hydrolase [Rhodobacteraceae bacterium]|nr:alpha/beta hydrolase [Paracoccaceae bacterium]